MPVTIIQDYGATFREDEPFPVYLRLKIPGDVNGSTQNMRDILVADLSAITIGSYLDDDDETVQRAASSLTPLTTYHFDTPRFGDAGPPGGWTFHVMAPADCFPDKTTTNKLVLQIKYIAASGAVLKIVRVKGHVLAAAAS